MPASYAHYRFGKLLLPKLPVNVRQCIQRFRRMYDMGLQGPDFFFYHNPFAKTSIGDLGNLFHNQSGQEFFTRACSQADSEAALAYLYGLLGHYCLDSVCHPFVNRMVAIGEAKHTALESEWERYLLAKDGVSLPYTYNRSRHIHLTRGECMTVASFYPNTTGAIVSRSVKIMAWCLRFLDNPNREKQEKRMRRFCPGLIEHLIPTQEIPDYGYMISELQECHDQALEKFPVLLEQLLQHKKDGTPLGKDFEPNFG